MVSTVLCKSEVTEKIVHEVLPEALSIVAADRTPDWEPDGGSARLAVSFPVGTPAVGVPYQLISLWPLENLN
jgi:hypothetical protein